MVKALRNNNTKDNNRRHNKYLTFILFGFCEPSESPGLHPSFSMLALKRIRTDFDLTDTDYTYNMLLKIITLQKSLVKHINTKSPKPFPKSPLNYFYYNPANASFSKPINYLN